MQLPNTFSPFAEKLSKLPHAKIATFIAVVLLGYIAYLLAQLTWLIVDTPNNNQPAQIGNVSAHQKGKTNIDIDGIRALNLFGNYDAAPIIDNEPEEAEDAPETSLNLTLTGVVASNDSTKSAAIIEHNNAQEIYAIDESIKGTRAVLKKVFNDRVHIRHSGRLETLMLDGFEYDENQNKKQTNNTQPPSKTVLKTSNLTKRDLAKNSPIKVNHQPARVDQRLNKALSKQAKAFKEDVGSDPGKIMDYLQIAPKRVDGNIIGYRLMPGKKPDFFKAAGLKSGDVAIQMNGLDLSQPSEAAQALKALREERDVSLLLDRDGDITEVLFSIDE